MIQANELRMGSKFYGVGMVQTVKEILDYGAKGSIQANNYTKVEAKEGYTHLILVEENRNQYKPVEMHPIPLTPWVLEAAGFTKNHNTGYWQFYSLSNHWHIGEWIADKPVAGFEQKGKFYYGDDYLEVKSLHQLQNLYFALTGEELEINFP